MRRAVTRKGAQYGTRAAKKVPRNTMKTNFKFLAGVLFLSIIVGCAAAFILQAPSLAINKITITGVCLSDKDVVNDAAEYMREKNILLVGKGLALKKIGALSEVAEVNIGRTLPDKIWIRVSERKPFAILTNGKDYYMADCDGFVFHKVDGPVKGVPLIKLDLSINLCLGKIGSADDIRSALLVLKCAHRKKLDITKISIDHVGNMCLNINGKFYIKLGQPDELEYKISQVQNAIDGRPSFAKDADYIDASCPRAIVWKPKL
ncbi:MAG: FtsQ-type POTRA domain-containing protein, partial [Armatimonadetes bacterium]|nr:FtsQ-type POTRA domain-containing protein [Armatimonadota bacterium]